MTDRHKNAARSMATQKKSSMRAFLMVVSVCTLVLARSQCDASDFSSPIQGRFESRGGERSSCAKRADPERRTERQILTHVNVFRGLQIFFRGRKGYTVRLSNAQRICLRSEILNAKILSVPLQRVYEHELCKAKIYGP